MNENSDCIKTPKKSNSMIRQHGKKRFDFGKQEGYVRNIGGPYQNQSEKRLLIHDAQKILNQQKRLKQFMTRERPKL